MRESYIKIVVVVSILILLLSMGLFLGLYDQVYLQYYEENKTNKLAEKILIPTFLLLFIIHIGSDFWKLGREMMELWEEYLISYFKIFLYSALMLIVFFRPITSGFIQLINVNIGNQERTKIIGLVTDKFETSGKAPEFELVILDESNEEFTFDTHSKEMKNYSVGGEFEKEMNKGCLGLYYIKSK